MKNALLLTFLLITLLMSCESNKKQNLSQVAMDKKNIIDSLISKYKIGCDFSSFEMKFTNNYSIDYKYLINSKYQLIDDIIISDIYEKDSVEYVSIRTGLFPTFYFDFPISKEQEKMLVKEDNDLVFIVSISKIRKIRLSIEGENDEEGAIVNIDNSNDFIGKGKIIDIISIKNKLQNEITKF